MASAPRIIIDAGHGGSEQAGSSSAYGASSPRGVVEKDVTLDIAKHVVARLGGAAALTRTRDHNLTLGARAAHGQRSDVFVSIHANYGAPELSGPEVYVHPEAGRTSRALAAQIARALDRQAGRYGGGAEERRAEMAVLNPRAVGQTAACLVEVDYLSNQRGEQRLGDPEQRAAIGAAIASAIQQHLASGQASDHVELDGRSPGGQVARAQQASTRALTLRGRDHGRVLINVPHQQPPDTRTLTFRGTADLRSGGGRRLGASLEDPSARDAIPRVTYVDLDPYTPAAFSFSWPCRNLLTPGVYEVVLRVEGANDDTHVVVDHTHSIA